MWGSLRHYLVAREDGEWVGKEKCRRGGEAWVAVMKAGEKVRRPADRTHCCRGSLSTAAVVPLPL